MTRTTLSIACFTVLLTLIAFVVSVTQWFGVSPDYPNYDIFFYNVRLYFSDEWATNRFEPAFVVASYFIAQLFESNVVVYSVIMCVGVAIKMALIGRFSNSIVFFILATTLYLAKYFSLHELTQLRASTAIAFLFLAFYFKLQRRWGLVALFSIVATLFHYSSLMFIPFLLMPTISLGKTLFIGTSVFVVAKLLLWPLLPILSKYFIVLDSYFANNVDFDATNFYSVVFVPEYCVIILYFLMWKKLTSTMKWVTSLQFFGFSILFGFSEVPVLGVRAREIYSFFWIVNVAQASFCSVEVRLVTILFVISMTVLGLYQYGFTDFFQPVVRAS